VKTEREFLHDISTPLATALFLIETFLEANGSDQNETGQKLHKKLMEMRHMLENRKNEIRT
jgi:hypothetical protein